MATRLTVRQWWILGYLHEHPGATLKQISKASPPHLAKTRAFHDRPHCRDEDYTVPSIEYATAQQSMQKLMARGLVRREPVDRNPADPPYSHFLMPHVAAERFDRDF